MSISFECSDLMSIYFARSPFSLFVFLHIYVFLLLHRLVFLFCCSHRVVLLFKIPFLLALVKRYANHDQPIKMFIFAIFCCRHLSVRCCCLWNGNYARNSMYLRGVQIKSLRKRRRIIRYDTRRISQIARNRAHSISGYVLLPISNGRKNLMQLSHNQTFLKCHAVLFSHC